MNCLKTDSTVRMILSHCCDALVTVASKAGGNSSAHSNKLLRLTFGASTTKMPYGHRGGNHPVREIETGRILITSQNHGFAVQGTETNIPGAPALEVTHVNLNDGTVEGLKHRELPVFAVQYHPEAAPGPHDARPLFEQFMETVRKSRV